METETAMTERRRPFSRYVDSGGVSRISFNPATWKGVLGLIGTILTTSLLISGIVLSMLKPIVTAWIKEENKPKQLEMAAAISALSIDLAEIKRTAVTREELDGRFSRMENRLDDIYRMLANGREH